MSEPEILIKTEMSDPHVSRLVLSYPDRRKYFGADLNVVFDNGEVDHKIGIKNAVKRLRELADILDAL